MNYLNILSATIFDGVITQNADPGTVVGKVMPVVWWAAVMLATVYVAYAGFKYATSSGDSNKLSEAKNQILNGVIGLAVVLLIGLIFRLVVSLL